MTEESHVPIRIALVGVGNICRKRHIPCIKRLGLKVVHAVDESEEARLLATSEFPKISISETLSEIPEETNAAILATPPVLHYEQSKWLLENGINILCEKPLCCTRKQAEELFELAHQNSLVLQVGYFRRFHPASNVVQFLLKNSTLGELRECLAFAGHSLRSGDLPPSFFNRQLSGGGVLMDIGCHVIDRLFSWFGDVSLVSYFDDFEGGVEANGFVLASGTLHQRQIPIRIQLSRTHNLGFFILLRFNRWNVKVDENQGHLIRLLSEPDKLDLLQSHSLSHVSSSLIENALNYRTSLTNGMNLPLGCMEELSGFQVF